jgi:hypothetical protein
MFALRMTGSALGREARTRSNTSFSITVTWRRERPKLASRAIPLPATMSTSSAGSMTPPIDRLTQIASTLPAIRCYASA